MSQVVLISYPSGGFGHFIFHVLTEFTNETYKPNNNHFTFSNTGDSHGTKIYSQIYAHDPDDYRPIIPDKNRTTLVLCDNGINNDEYIKIRKYFINEKIVRVVIDPMVRPVIYQTCVLKAMKESSVESQHTMDKWVDHHEDYAKRENFTLLYHNWPFKWDNVKEDNIINFNLEKLIVNAYSAICELIDKLGFSLRNKEQLQELCARWTQANSPYFLVYHLWKQIEVALDTGSELDLSNISDLHTQGYINYCLEQKFNCTIPVYDYRNWFNSTQEMRGLAQ